MTKIKLKKFFFIERQDFHLILLSSWLYMSVIPADTDVFKTSSYDQRRRRHDV